MPVGSESYYLTRKLLLGLQATADNPVDMYMSFWCFLRRNLDLVVRGRRGSQPDAATPHIESNFHAGEKVVNDSEVSGPWKDAGLVRVTQKLHKNFPEHNASVNKSGGLPISHILNLSMY